MQIPLLKLIHVCGLFPVWSMARTHTRGVQGTWEGYVQCGVWQRHTQEECRVLGRVMSSGEYGTGTPKRSPGHKGGLCPVWGMAQAHPRGVWSTRKGYVQCGLLHRHTQEGSRTQGRVMSSAEYGACTPKRSPRQKGGLCPVWSMAQAHPRGVQGTREGYVQCGVLHRHTQEGSRTQGRVMSSAEYGAGTPKRSPRQKGGVMSSVEYGTGTPKRSSGYKGGLCPVWSIAQAHPRGFQGKREGYVQCRVWHRHTQEESRAKGWVISSAEYGTGTPKRSSEYKGGLCPVWSMAQAHPRGVQDTREGYVQCGVLHRHTQEGSRVKGRVMSSAEYGTGTPKRSPGYKVGLCPVGSMAQAHPRGVRSTREGYVQWGVWHRHTQEESRVQGRVMSNGLCANILFQDHGWVHGAKCKSISGWNIEICRDILNTVLWYDKWVGCGKSKLLNRQKANNPNQLYTCVRVHIFVWTSVEAVTLLYV